MGRELKSAGELDIRVISQPDEIADLAAHWRALEEAGGSPLTYFQGYDWCANWIARFAQRPGGPQPHIRTLWQDGRLLAVWPLMISGSGIGLRRLEALGEPHTQYCNMLAAPELSADAARLLVEGLFAESGFDVAVFKPVPEGSRLAAALAELPPIRGYENEASVLDLSEFASSEAYTAQLGKLQKRNRNRRRNHLARMGELSFEVLWPDHPEFTALVGQAVAFKRRWLTETNRISLGFSMEGYEAFLGDLGGDAAALAGACLSVLKVGDRPVAVELGFIHHKHYYAYIGGFNWELKELSPGKVQMDFTVGWLIDQGVTAYDLLVNPADYKQSWSNRAVKLVGYAAPKSWRGRAYADAWLPTIRPAIKALHGRLPQFAERLTWLARGLGCVVIYV